VTLQPLEPDWGALELSTFFGGSGFIGLGFGETDPTAVSADFTLCLTFSGG
jgi:hypothetical protein